MCVLIVQYTAAGFLLKAYHELWFCTKHPDYIVLEIPPYARIASYVLSKIIFPQKHRLFDWYLPRNFVQNRSEEFFYYPVTLFSRWKTREMSLHTRRGQIFKSRCLITIRSANPNWTRMVLRLLFFSFTFRKLWDRQVFSRGYGLGFVVYSFEYNYCCIENTES